jgi:hypothetical protein
MSKGVRRVRIFRGAMLIFMQHRGVVRRLFMEVRPPALATVGDSHQRRIAHSHECNGNSMVSPRDSFKFEVSSFKQEEPGAPRLRIRGHRLWAGARGRMRKTNPISHRRRRLTDEIVQNEAKLGETGVYGQRRLPWGPRVGRGVKCAKRTQFPPAGGDRRRKSFERNPIWSRRGQICKTRCPRQKSESGESIFDIRPKTLVAA